MTVPQGQDAAQLRSALLADPRVRSAERVGRIQGAKSKASRESSEGEEASEESSKEVSAATGLDWHRGAINAPTLRAGEAASYVVAVLDTGVAYENYKSDGDKYKAAPSLKKSSFVSAYDFVNGDTHANDDNQHYRLPSHALQAPATTRC